MLQSRRTMGRKRVAPPRDDGGMVSTPGEIARPCSEHSPQRSHPPRDISSRNKCWRELTSIRAIDVFRGRYLNLEGRSDGQSQTIEQCASQLSMQIAALKSRQLTQALQIVNGNGAVLSKLSSRS
jgi:hypothetical protein